MLFQNSSSKKIALFVSFAICFLNFFSLVLLNYYIGIKNINWLTFAVLGLVVVILSYLITFYIIRLVLFSKLNVIYKIIRDSKRKKNDRVEAADLSNLKLDQVEIEVTEWATQTKDEIEYLKRLEDYRRTFVGNLSHELKTPIFSVQGYIHTLIEGGLYDEKINTKYLERAAANLQRIENIVEDLEMINKLESGGETMTFSTFNILKLIQELIKDIQFQAKTKNIHMFLFNDPSSEYKVEADKDQIRQVLINLITNAIRYGKESGEVKISVYDLQETFLIEVSDDGIGMSEEHLTHVFDRFYRIDPSRSRQIGGSGLGLSIVKHIIEAHDQNINVRSTVGVGSTFGFSLKKG